VSPAAGRLLPVGAALLLSWWLALLGRELRGAFRARSHWSEPPGDVDGLVYVALGDSLAQGVGARRPARGYVGLIAAELAARTGKSVTIINLSRSGARIRDVLAKQLPALKALAVAPDLVTVDIGANDIPLYDAPRFAQEADELTKALPAGTVVFDVPYFMHGHWEKNALEASDVLTTSAHRRGLSVVPVHEALRKEGWRAMLTEFAPDWFHPNDRGYRIWARAFWTRPPRTVEESLGRLRSTTAPRP
jgi:acyl-CoA thioesterase-1